MGHLDDLLPIRQVLVDGIAAPYAPKLNFSGAFVTLSVDPQDPSSNVANVTFVGANPRQDLALVAAQKETDQTGWVVIGARQFDPSQFDFEGLTATFTFGAILCATSGMTAQVRLYNVTDGTVVESSVLSTTALVSTALSVELEVPGDLPNSLKLYEAQLRISAGTPVPSDRAICLYAGLEALLSG
jgi:hypothetical protein